MEWLPIETAPKDGSWLLLYEDADIPVCGYWHVIDEHDFSWSGWTYADVLLAEVRPEGVRPTHWMPLPESPK